MLNIIEKIKCRVKGRMQKLHWLMLGLLAVILVGCSHAPKKYSGKHKNSAVSNISLAKINIKGDRREIVLYALGLLGVNYQFGGNNPEAGLDCSGMVGFIYKNALGIQLPRSAAQIVNVAKIIPRSQLQAGDFVFFNTLNRPYSHMGIYIGDNKFIHAPSSRSRIKVANLAMPYFATRFETAATLFQ
jgi:cell wall-associated NlpC family hydrolase